jgi:hypothetical protein
MYGDGIMKQQTARHGWPCSAAITLFVLFVGSIQALNARGEVHADAEMNSFLNHSGINLPWINYGWDLGRNPWGGVPGGFAANRASLEADFTYLREHHVKLCRVFLFCDFRTGLNLDIDGNVLGLDSYVVPDMETLLDVAATKGIRLIPVLLDYTLANGVEMENGNTVGEFPEYITNATMRAQLLTNALHPFLEQFGDHDAIYAWDIINEPRLAVAVSQPEMRSFIEDIAALIRTTAPEAKVTVGFYDRYHLNDYGHELCDLTQVHYYDHMSYYWDYDTPAIEISDKSTFFGEIAPDNVGDQLNTAIENGYTGVLFWSLNKDYDFRVVADAYSDWVQSAFSHINRNLAIADLSVSDSSFNLLVAPTYPGNRYRILASTNLLAGGWMPLSVFTGSPATNATQVTAPQPGSSTVFLRIDTEL